ncbi:transposase, partial [Shewanella abyssi]|nr:transposase [Shewanella abyssi]
FTSLKLRVTAALKGKQPSKLLPFIGNEREHQPKGIAFSLKDYLELVDETGRVIRDDKRGAISANAEKILNRLNIPTKNWVKIITEFGQLFHGPVGTLQELDSYCEHLGKRRRHFSNSCQYMQVD